MKHQTTKIYAMQTIGYEGATPDTRFTFNAKNDKDAESKMQGWARYHRYMLRDVAVREANENEAQWPTRNEYL